MMTLGELFDQIIECNLSDKEKELQVTDIANDSRRIRKGSLFLALKGKEKDGHDFIREAVQRGAVAVISEHYVSQMLKSSQIYYYRDRKLSEKISDLAKRFFRDPGKEIKTVAVTGTNGKTTVTYLVESVLTQAKILCGVKGTINERVAENITPVRNTTAGIIDNQCFLAKLRDQGITHCVMEVSSHALDQGRIRGIDFDVAIFTNLSQDHLDYHRDMDQYFLSKSKLFDSLKNTAVSVINQDDPYGQKLIKKIETPLVTYGIKKDAEFRAKDLKYSLQKTQCTLEISGSQHFVRSSLIGEHNVYNILAAVACACQLQIDPAAIIRGIELLDHVPGRLERIVNRRGFDVFVDYAHTDDALRNVLTILRRQNPRCLIVVFGCGGNRDKGKRPKMGRVAERLADHVIITNDNPRQEGPEQIMKNIIAGFKSRTYEVIYDRKQAIETALAKAREGDIVLIAGKGHETDQIFKESKQRFDDCQVVREYLR